MEETREPRRHPTKRRLFAGGLLAIAVLGGVALFDHPASRLAPQGQSALLSSRMMELRRAAEFWRETHENAACPTPDQLKRDGAIDPATPLIDSWGAQLRIVCESDDTAVVSLGRDGQPETADDIRVPEAIPPPTVGTEPHRGAEYPEASSSAKHAATDGESPDASSESIPPAVCLPDERATKPVTPCEEVLAYTSDHPSAFPLSPTVGDHLRLVGVLLVERRTTPQGDDRESWRNDPVLVDPRDPLSPKLNIHDWAPGALKPAPGCTGQAYVEIEAESDVPEHGRQGFDTSGWPLRNVRIIRVFAAGAKIRCSRHLEPVH